MTRTSGANTRLHHPTRQGLAGGALVFSMVCALMQGCGTESVDESEFSGGADAGGGCSGDSCGVGFVCLDDTCFPEGTCIDNDDDGFGEGCSAGDDCDDTRFDVNPARSEICDDEDNDCDFSVDEGGVCTPCNPSCTPGTALCTGEQVIRCDDSSGCARYGTPETCPGGQFCQQGACVQRCEDVDGDGFGVRCTDEREDCDDTRSDVYPGAPELCDELDNNCDTRTDENFICDSPTECVSNCVAGPAECVAGGGARVECVEGPVGCFRSRATVCPAGTRCANGTCSAAVTCVDRDGDGAGPGCATNDCRPSDRTSHPAATEVCDGLDNNCNGVVDDGGVCTTCDNAPIESPVVVPASGSVYRVSCGGAEYFAVDGVAAGSTLYVVSGGTSDVPLAIGRSGASFTAVANDEPVGGFRMARYTAPSAGRYLIRATAAGGSAYQLAIAVDDGACTTDAYEPNNSPLSAMAIGATGFAGGQGMCSGELDFYSVTASPGNVLSAALGHDGEGGALLMTIWRNGTEVTTSFGSASSDGLINGRHAHMRLDLPGEYVVGVRGFRPGVTTDYALNLRVERAAACTDDSFETTGGLDNDTVATASSVASASVSGVLCPGDYDIYRVGNKAEGSQISGSFSGAAGLEVATLLNGWGARRLFPTPVSAAGEYYIVVFGSTPDATGNYTLNWR